MDGIKICHQWQTNLSVSGFVCSQESAIFQNSTRGWQQMLSVLNLFNICPTRCNTKRSIYYYASSLYWFRVSGTPNTRSTQNCKYTFRYWSLLATLEGSSCTNIWPVPEAVVTVFCTPDDGNGWHPKHVEWTCRIINRLLSFDVLLTVHLSIFISVINQFDAHIFVLQ